MTQGEKKGILSQEWNNYLVDFHDRQKDIYFTEQYVRLYLSAVDTVECFVYRQKEKTLLFPYLKRKIRFLEEDYWDFETPYGYGGPIANTNDQGFLKQALEEFYLTAQENNFVAGFIRCHSLLENYRILENGPAGCGVCYDRATVVLDLENDAQKIFQEQIHSKHRNVIRRAEKSGLIYRIDEELRYLDDFTSMYRAGMTQKNADRFYLFDDTYFNNLKKMGESVFLGTVFLGDRMIAGAVFFKYGIFGHYHLAGSLAEYEKYYPNNFLLFKTALYLKEKGVKLFHLGGGTDNSPDNSLLKFKERFSKDRSAFYIGKIIFNKDIYKEVCRLWENEFPEKAKAYKNNVLKYRF